MADKPPLLDASLDQGKTIYLRWERPRGWLVGKITENFTQRPKPPRASSPSSTTVSSGSTGGRTTSSTLTTTTRDWQRPTTSRVLLEKEE